MRRFQRVRVNLLGRYMLLDRREYPCQVSNMSPGGMALIAPVAGNVGERVIAYVDHVGRLEGVVARHFQNGLGGNRLAHNAQSAANTHGRREARFEMQVAGALFLGAGDQRCEIHQ